MSDIRFNQWLHQSGTGGVSQVASGAVGVGTTNPLADFYVRGDAQITGILTAGHIAMGSSITFGDDDRAYFGDGTDLQIYHSGSHSFIQDTGTGNLFIDSNSVQIRNAVASKTTAKFMENAQVELYYNNTERIRTTNTGAVVTGILTATSFSGGSGSTSSLDAGILDLKTGGNIRLRFASGGEAQFRGDTNPIASFDRGSANSTNVSWKYLGAARGQVSSTSGEFRLTADGTIPMTFYSNSNERLRITSDGILSWRSSSTALSGTSNTYSVNIYRDSGGGYGYLDCVTGSSNHTGWYMRAYHNGTYNKVLAHNTSDETWFETGGQERLRIKSTGEVGISPASCTPSAGDLSSGDSQNTPIIHVKGSGSSATGGEFNLLGRFEAGGDANDTGAMIVLNHSNDRGLALVGGRGSSNRSFGAIKAIDNLGRLTNVMAFGGGNGQGVDYLAFYTGESTSTTSRLHIDSSGRVMIGSSTYIGGAALAVLGTSNTPNTYGCFAIGRVGANVTNNTAIANIRLNGGTLGTGRGAEINAYADANWSDGSSHPTRLTFHTVASSSTSAQERLRINSDGHVQIGTAADPGNTLRYVDIGNYNTGSSAGSILRLISRKSDGSSSASADIVKYKSGGLVINNNEAIGTTGFISFGTATGGGSTTERLRITSEGYVTTPNRPAFKCFIDSDTSPNSGTVSENNGFTLNSTSSRDAFNTGSHFNEATGRFTAPVTGLYFFHFSVMRHGGNGSGPIEMRIKKNNSLMYARAYKSTYSVSYQSDNVTTITNMTAGHYVEFMIGSNMSVYFDDSYMLGYLIG